MILRVLVKFRAVLTSFRTFFLRPFCSEIAAKLPRLAPVERAPAASFFANTRNFS